MQTNQRNRPTDCAHAPVIRSSHFRFYGPLNDFLPMALRQRSCAFQFSGQPTLRDAIQAQGVPHTEVDLILVDGQRRSFEDHLSGYERISVFPKFRTLSLPQGDRLGPPPLTEPRFILDVHLGKLCRHLRLLGFDTHYRNDFEDAYIIDCAVREQRMILTRDLGILKQKRVQYGYFVRATDPPQQINEVLQALDLAERCSPLTRCINCNGVLARVSKQRVIDQIPAGTQRSYDLFYQCRRCQQVYWRGAHYLGLVSKLARHIPQTQRSA